MKKTMLMMAVAVLVAGSAIAKDDNNPQKRQHGKDLNGAADRSCCSQMDKCNNPDAGCPLAPAMGKHMRSGPAFSADLRDPSDRTHQQGEFRKSSRDGQDRGDGEFRGQGRGERGQGKGEFRGPPRGERGQSQGEFRKSGRDGQDRGDGEFRGQGRGERGQGKGEFRKSNRGHEPTEADKPARSGHGKKQGKGDPSAPPPEE